MINCFRQHKGAYGRIRIKKALAPKGIHLSEWKIAQILEENNLHAKCGRKRSYKKPVKTEEEIIRENLLLNNKELITHCQKNDVWSSDITRIQTKTGILYLAGILDISTRKLLGYRIDHHQRQEIVHEAIEMAVLKKPADKEVIFHSDRGTQYTANRTQALLHQHRLKSSMSRPGKPNDNQYIESFWRSLKVEIGKMTTYTSKESKRILLEYCNQYNAHRLHSSIGYKTPSEMYAQS